ncbi:hypothetical protein Dimus_011381 [Dionaea muscipula]
MKTLGEVGEGSFIQVPIIHDYGVKEPLQVRAKGCGKRLKGGKEKAIKKVKARRCNGCGLIGQSHDKRNCPQLLNISSQSAMFNDEDEEEGNDDDDDDTNECKCFIRAFCFILVLIDPDFLLIEICRSTIVVVIALTDPDFIRVRHVTLHKRLHYR